MPDTANTWTRHLFIRIVSVAFFSALAFVPAQAIDEYPDSGAFPTTTTVSTSAPTIFVGQSVTITAIVSSLQGSIPDGETITFFEGFEKNRVQIGTGTTSGGVARLTTSSLPAGGDALTAVYPGDGTFKASHGTFKQAVDKYTTTTTIVSSQNPSHHGDPPIFTITVSSNEGGPAPTGIVFVTYGIGNLTLFSGTAQAEMPDYSPGHRSFTGHYRGDDAHKESTSQPLIQVILWKDQ
jgi:large repetitive protein